jgi:hypothetical protein
LTQKLFTHVLIKAFIKVSDINGALTIQVLLGYIQVWEMTPGIELAATRNS